MVIYTLLPWRFLKISIMIEYSVFYLYNEDIAILKGGKKMKLSDYENPFTGKESNLFDLGRLFSLFLGVVVLILIFMFGEKIVNYFFPTKASPSGEAPVTRIIL